MKSCWKTQVGMVERRDILFIYLFISFVIHYIDKAVHDYRDIAVMWKGMNNMLELFVNMLISHFFLQRSHKYTIFISHTDVWNAKLSHGHRLMS